MWSVCEQPGGDADAAQKAAFVLAASDAPKVEGAGRLRGDQALYVEGPDGTRYLVDAHGTAFRIGGAAQTAGDPTPLLHTLFGDGARPQRVTADWLRTLNRGRPLVLPPIPGLGGPAGVPGLDAAYDRVGTVLKASGGGAVRQYVVLKGEVAPVSGLVAALLLGASGTPAAQPVAPADLTPAASAYLGDTGWPQQLPRQADTAGARTVCGVYLGTLHGTRPELGVWAGAGYPAPVVGGGATAYVTPGSGLLYREAGGGADGAVHLVTDTGLSYEVPSATASSSGTADRGGRALARLGYGEVRPVPVPSAWSAFLPAGPALDVDAAAQQQGS